MQWNRILIPTSAEVNQAIEEMELRYDQIDRIRRLKPRVDGSTEADPIVIFDVRRLPAVVAEFLRVDAEPRLKRLAERLL